MARITATINIDFQTSEKVTQEAWELFKKNMGNNIINDFETVVDGLAQHCGFDSQEIHSALLDDLECDFDEEE